MMLPQRVLIAFPVFIEDGSGRAYAHATDGERSHKFRGAAGKGSAVKGGVSGETVKAGALESRCVPVVVNIAVRGNRKGSLGAWHCGKAGGSAAVLACDENILGAFPVGAEDNLAAVRGPERVRLIGPVGCNLEGLAAFCGNSENISLITEGYGFAVWGDGAAAHPLGSFLGANTDCRNKCCEADKNTFHKGLLL